MSSPFIILAIPTQSEQEAAERITRFIRYVVLRKNGLAQAILVQSVTKKKRHRRSSFKKIKDIRAMHDSFTEGDTVMEGTLNKKSSGKRSRMQPRYFRLVAQSSGAAKELT